MRPYGPAALRLCVGAVFASHGLQKLFGLWGGQGLDGTTAMIASWGLNPAYPLAILGGLTRWVALALLVETAVAVWKVNYLNEFFITTQGAIGAEYRLVLIGALLCLMLGGPGAVSIDEWRNSSAEAMRAGRARARK